MRDIPISDEMIRLGQFLKLANASESGSDARRVIATGLVLVNNEVELRRGRQLQLHDVVAVEGAVFRVVRDSPTSALPIPHPLRQCHNGPGGRCP